MKLKLILILTLALSTYSIASYSKGLTSGSNLNPLDWQIVELENLIFSKIQAKLESKIPDKTYSVDVKIETSIPKKPNFKQTPPTPPEEIKYTNAPKQKSNGDYIVFSKFGMEAPVISKLNKKNPPKKSEFEYLWKYQETQSVYKNLVSVDINIKLNNKIQESQRNSLELFLKNTNFNLGEVTPAFKFKYIDFTPLSESKLQDFINQQNKVDSSALNTKELMDKLATPFALVLAALIFVAGAFLILRRIEAMKKAQTSLKQMHEGNINTEGDNKDDDSSSEMIPGMSDSPLADEIHVSGLDRFRELLLDSTDTAVLLVRDWIKQDTKDSTLALMYLLEKLNSDELHSIFAKLKMQERQTWKNYIYTSFHSQKSDQKSDQFIAKEVINNFIVPDVITDLELRNQIITLDELNASKFIADFPDFAHLLINVAPSSLLPKIMAKLNSEECSRYLNQAVTVTEEKIQSMLGEFKEKLSPYLATEKTNPFIDKLAQLIPFASYKEEESLYQTLIQNNQLDKAKSVALDSFPSFLVKDFSHESLKTIITSFPMTQRAFIVESIEDKAFREELITSFAPENSSTREMLELELEQFVINIGAKRELAETKEEHITSFYKKSKELTHRNSKLATNAHQIVEAWILNQTEDNTIAA